MSPVATGVRLVLAASLIAGAVGACQGADPYYRNRPDGGALGLGGAGGSPFHPSIAGSSGYAGGGATGQGAASGLAGNSGAAGSGGAGTFGAAGASGDAGVAEPCTTCMVKLQYACRGSDTSQASFVLDVTNESSTTFPLSSLTLRYWYTADAAKEQELDCDFAKLGCSNIVTSADTNPAPKFVNVQPPKMNATKYAEVAFKASAQSLDPFLDTGEIQLRLHNKDNTPIDQTDDYSYDAPYCTDMQGTAVAWQGITAYLDGVLVWGTEPGPPQ